MPNIRRLGLETDRRRERKACNIKKYPYPTCDNVKQLGDWEGSGLVMALGCGFVDGP